MLNASPRATRFSALLLALGILFQSCGYIALTRKTKLISPTEDVSLSFSETEDGQFKNISTQKIKLNHFKKKYFIRMEKSGFVSRTHEITRTTRNKLKRLDIILLMQTGIFASIFTPLHFLTESPTGGAHSLGQKIALFSALGIGVAGWGAVVPCPGYIFPKTVELPKLIPILTKDANQLSLTVGKHEFKINKSVARVRDYQTMEQFSSGYGYESRNSAASFEFLDDLKMYDEIAALLDSTEYGIDSVNAKLDKALRLGSKTRSMVFMTADGKLRCEVQTAWALETLDELQYLYDRTMSGNSEWLDFNEAQLDELEQQVVIKTAFVDAIDASLKKFIALDTIQSILSAPVPIPLLNAMEMELERGTIFGQSVSDAVKAVVTVITTKGHGSGCVVTPDGYIITNAHVVEDDTTKIKAILGSDLDRRFPLKFIRMNDAVDLALLKLDTIGLLPLQFARNEQIEVGSDVYAIGTPADVKLGQTVTRGIISGKRKFGGHHMIQTDVAISPGNSGGALIRSDGTLCGIVTSALDGREIHDIGFAIPAPIIEDALKIKLN